MLLMLNSEKRGLIVIDGKSGGGRVGKMGNVIENSLVSVSVLLSKTMAALRLASFWHRISTHALRGAEKSSARGNLYIGMYNIILNLNFTNTVLANLQQ